MKLIVYRAMHSRQSDLLIRVRSLAISVGNSHVEKMTFLRTKKCGICNYNYTMDIDKQKFLVDQIIV